MQQSWKLSGAYATWKITVAIEAPEDARSPDVPEWPSEKLAPVVGHFFEAVNYYETSRDAEGVLGLN